MVESVNAQRDAFTAYSEHGPATVNVTFNAGDRTVSALPGPIIPQPPDLPTAYHPRETDIAALKRLLLSGDPSTGIISRSRAAGLRGMGGLGKTVLATALVQDPDVLRAFPFGIVWLTFGRTASALTQLNVLAYAVTGQRLDYQAVAEARTSLAQILGERRLLIVLDDVWDPGLVEGFRSLGSSCHLLITTREQAMLDRANASSRLVGLLDPPAARALFAQALGSSNLPDAAASVIDACGGLPLALAAAAAMVRRTGWAHTQAALDRRRLDTLRTGWLPDEQKNLAVVLAASVSALPDRERACFLECATWPEDVPVPPTALGLYWSAHVPDSFEQEEIAATLADASVLQQDTAGLLRLHDLYHDYLRHHAGDGLNAMHGAVADRCVRFDNDRCALLDRSDWTLAHLPWHLAQAQRPADAKALLLDYHWLESKVAKHGVQALVADAQLIVDPDLQELGKALRLSAHVLARDPEQLGPQLIGRLHGSPAVPTTQLLADAAANLPANALVPRGGKHLTAPGALVATLAGHAGPVTGALLLPDARRALSWSNDRTLRLWDFDSGTARTLEGHADRVSGALLLPDARRALSWSNDNTLRLWELDSGAALALEGHASSVSGALLLPDARRALSWSDDNTLRLWDLDSGTARTLEGHAGRVSGALLLPDARRALSWSYDNTLRLWDLDSGTARVFEGHAGRVSGALLLPDARRALSWSYDNTLRLWDLDRGTARALEGHTGWVGGALLLPDARQALSWSDDSTLRLWDIENGTARVFEGHAGRVSGALLLPDARRALSWSWDNTLRLWDLDRGTARVFEGHASWVFGALLLPDALRALSWSWNNTLRLWDLDRGTARALEGHTGWVGGALLLPDARRALSWSNDDTLRLWDLDSGTARALEGHASSVSGALLLPDARRALSWSYDNTLRLWDLADQREIKRFVGDDPIPMAVYSPERQMVVAGDSRGRVMFFDLP